MTHYVVVRRDLPLGFLAAQVVHAAGESSPGNLSEGTNAVVLQVAGERELVELAAALAAAGVEHRLIREPDAPWNGAATAIGCVPIADRAIARRVLATLPLLGKEEAAQAA